MTSNSENQNPNPSLPARHTRGPEPDPATEYPLLANAQTMTSMLRLIDDNLRAGKLDVIKLSRIRVSRDGVFQVEKAEGPEIERSLEVIITSFRQARVYWGRPYSQANVKQPPMCTSTDGFTGVGDPGGECSKCPFSKFKSAKNPDGSQGAGQACKELRQLLVVLPGQMMPHRLDVAPTSLQHFDKYSLNLIYTGTPYWGVIAKLGLEQGPSGGGPVQRITFSLKRRLSAEQVQALEPYHERMSSFLKPMAVDVEANDMGEAGPRTEQPGDNDIPF